MEEVLCQRTVGAFFFSCDDEMNFRRGEGEEMMTCKDLAAPKKANEDGMNDFYYYLFFCKDERRKEGGRR